MIVKVKKLTETARIPTRGSRDAAGYDLYACIQEDGIVIKPHDNAMIGTGLKIAIPAGYFGAVFARSGLASREGLRPANCVGVCDSDYRGEYTVCIYNDSDEERLIFSGDRIAQLVVLPCQDIEFQVVSALNDTERGADGFGSTGKS